jgi:hypothetical protein
MMLPIALLLLTAAAQSDARPPATPAADACHVLTKREVAAVQGEAFTTAKLTSRGAISQCLYQLPSFSKSVSVDVLRGSAKEFWREHFDRPEEDERPRGAAHSEEQEEESSRPAEVDGIGDEAYWAGSHIAGSLYVRRGDSMLRVSVGGPGSEAEKRAKAKKLARNALRRL